MQHEGEEESPAAVVEVPCPVGWKPRIYGAPNRIVIANPVFVVCCNISVTASAFFGLCCNSRAIALHWHAKVLPSFC